MAVAFSQQSFLSSNPLPPIFKHRPKKENSVLQISCTSSMDNDPNQSRGKEMQLGKLAFLTLATTALTFGSVHEAMAAKTGGRVGGHAFRSSAPRSSGPRINNSRTNVYINPPLAPPLGGYGYGVPFYGGWGWSPFSFFAPGPSVAIGVGGGFEFIALFLVLGAVATVSEDLGDQGMMKTTIDR